MTSLIDKSKVTQPTTEPTEMMATFPIFQFSRGGSGTETAGQPKFCLRYFPVHILISVPGIVENRKMEILRVPVKESHSRAYGCAQRVGAKFGT